MADDNALQEAASYVGEWWLQEAPDERVAGTLSYDPGTGLRLVLIGSFGDVAQSLARIQGVATYHTIFGITTDGKAITLLRALQSNSQLNVPGMLVETYVALQAVVGVHVDDRDTDFFIASEVSFDGLDHWLAQQPFGVEHADNPRRTTIHIVPVDEWVIGALPSDGGRVVANMSIHLSQERLQRIDAVATNRIGVLATHARSLDWHLRQLEQLNRLTALCTGRHLAMHRLRLKVDDIKSPERAPGSEWVELLLQLKATGASRASADPPIYSASELLQENPDVIASWFAVSDALQPVIDLFFTVLADRNLPLEVAFLLVVQAIEVHHRRTTPTLLIDPAEYEALKARLIAALPEAAAEAIREKVEGTLAHANEPNLRQRLVGIARKLEPAFGKNPMGFDKKQIQATVSTRNYYTHYSSHLEGSAKTGLELHRLTERFKPLLFALILAELGLSFESIREHLSRRRDLNPH